ncbi:acetyltransferase [Bacteroides sp.]
MKNLIIVGAGGMGRTMYDMARESIGFGTEFIIKGFIDDNPAVLDNFENYLPLVGTISDYVPKREDVFICSIGGISRRECIIRILERGGEFIPLIHNTARIGTNVVMGRGNMVGAFTTIAADAKVGDYNFIQSYTIIGHDVTIGDWNRIDSQVMLVGGITIGHHNMIHTAAVLNHNVVVGNNTHIGACSFVTRNVESGTTIFSSPARRLI